MRADGKNKISGFSGRRTFSLRDSIFIGIPLAAAALLLLLFSLFPKGERAVVTTAEGESFSLVLNELTEPAEREIRGSGGIKATLLFESGGARFLSSNCPDRTCVKTGVINKAGETALCVPGGISVRIEGSGGFDAQTH